MYDTTIAYPYVYDTTAANNLHTYVTTVTHLPMYDITTIHHLHMQNTSVTRYAPMHNATALPHPHLWRHKRYTRHMYDTTHHPHLYDKTVSHHPHLYDTTVSHHPHLYDTTVTHRPCLYDTTVICPHPHDVTAIPYQICPIPRAHTCESTVTHVSATPVTQLLYMYQPHV